MFQIIAITFIFLSIGYYTLTCLAFSYRLVPQTSYNLQENHLYQIIFQFFLIFLEKNLIYPLFVPDLLIIIAPDLLTIIFPSTPISLYLYFCLPLLYLFSDLSRHHTTEQPSFIVRLILTTEVKIESLIYQQGQAAHKVGDLLPAWEQNYLLLFSFSQKIQEEDSYLDFQLALTHLIHLVL